MPPLTVHHLGYSQSERIVWTCEELGIDYELKKYDRAPVLGPAEYKKLHPLGAAPVITDGDLTLAESGAIVEYLCQVYGGGRFVVKPGEPNYPDYLYWFHFANGTFVSAMMRILTIQTAGGAAAADPSSPIVQRFTDKVTQILRMVDDRLAVSPYLSGPELTAADLMNVVCLTGLRSFVPLDLSGYDNVLAYLARVSERGAYRRALQKGDPDQDVGQRAGAAPPPLQKGLAAMKEAMAKAAGQ